MWFTFPNPKKFVLITCWSLICFFLFTLIFSSLFSALRFFISFKAMLRSLFSRSVVIWSDAVISYLQRETSLCSRGLRTVSYKVFCCHTSTTTTTFSCTISQPLFVELSLLNPLLISDFPKFSLKYWPLLAPHPCWCHLKARLKYV